MPSAEKTAIDGLMVGAPTGVIAMLGYIGWTLGYSTKKLSPRRLAGGIMLSGFVGWAAYMFISHTGMDPSLSAAVASAIGATGDRGFELLFEVAKTKMGGK